MREFLTKRVGWLLPLFLALIGIMLGDYSMLMAEVTVAAPGAGATPGTDGLNTQMDGQGTSVSAIENSGEGSEVIENDLDTEISKFRTDFFPLDTIMRRAVRTVNVSNYKVDAFNIDAQRIKAQTTTQHTESVSKKRITLPIEDTDATVFQVYDTINVSGVHGYEEDGVTEKPSEELMLYVVDVDGSSNLPIVIAINGKKQTPSDVECYIPTIPEGTMLYNMGNAGSESQLYCPPSNKVPVPKTVYLQKRMSNTKFTTYFDMVKKKISWEKADIIEAALWEFRRKCEISYLKGAKRCILQRDSQNPTRGAENVYFSEGIVWSIKKSYEYNVAQFLMDDFLAITKMAFTGHNGSKNAIVLCGKNLLERMLKIDVKRYSGIAMQTTTKWGIKLSAYESSFGNLNIVHMPILDEIGMEDMGMVLDLDMLSRFKLEEKSKKLDQSVNGEDAERNVTIMTDAPVLKGFNHMLIVPSSVHSPGYSAGTIKVASAATLPDNPSEGDCVYLTASVGQTETNDAFVAGQIAQWNGVKWVKYEGDMYV